MPRTKQQFEAMRQATREKIQSAATTLFAQKGLGGTSVQEIADLAGISIGLLYRHYKTKEALFDEMVDYARVGLEQVTALLSSDLPPRDIITGFVEEITTDLSSSSEFTDYIMMITQAIGSGLENETLTALVAQDRQMLDALEALVVRGQREGDFHAGDPHDMALLFAAAMQGIGQFRLLLREDFRPPAAASLAGLLLASRAE